MRLDKCKIVPLRIIRQRTTVKAAEFLEFAPFGSVVVIPWEYQSLGSNSLGIPGHTKKRRHMTCLCIGGGYVRMKGFEEAYIEGAKNNPDLCVVFE
jgi:hypothetical protein